MGFLSAARGEKRKTYDRAAAKRRQSHADDQRLAAAAAADVEASRLAALRQTPVACGGLQFVALTPPRA